MTTQCNQRCGQPLIPHRLHLFIDGQQYPLRPERDGAYAWLPGGRSVWQAQPDAITILKNTVRRLLAMEDRLWSRVTKTDTCWLWEGHKLRTGYGMITDPRPGSDGRHIPVHRLAYEFMVGPIPEGLTIDHLCRVRNCVNPAHMEPVTARENTLRGIGPTAVNARKTHCKYGHPFSGDNLIPNLRGERACRACAKQHDHDKGVRWREYTRRCRHYIDRPYNNTTRCELASGHQGSHRLGELEWVLGSWAGQSTNSPVRRDVRHWLGNQP